MPAVYLQSVCRTPDESQTLGEGIDRQRTATFEAVLLPRYYRVEPTLVLSDPRLPAYLTPYRNGDGTFLDPLCVARTAGITRSGTDQAKLRLVYNFSTTPRTAGAGQLELPAAGGPPQPGGGGEGGGGGAGTPTDLATEYGWDYEEFQYAPAEDFDRRPILNTADDVVLPAPTVLDAHLIVSVTRWEETFDIKKWARFKYARNIDPFWGYPPKRVLCMPWRCPARKEVGGRYWYQHAYQFKFSETDWELSFPSMGVREYSVDVPPPDGPLLAILDPTTKQPVTFPWPLDEDGVAVVDPRTEKPFTCRFRVNADRLFKDLNIKPPP